MTLLPQLSVGERLRCIDHPSGALAEMVVRRWTSVAVGARSQRGSAVLVGALALAAGLVLGELELALDDAALEVADLQALLQ